jgi:hypothetical protein
LAEISVFACWWRSPHTPDTAFCNAGYAPFRRYFSRAPALGFSFFPVTQIGFSEKYEMLGIGRSANSGQWFKKSIVRYLQFGHYVFYSSITC